MSRHSLPPNAEAAAKTTRAALIDIESRAHAALKATASESRSFTDPIVASREIAARIAPVVLTARQAARRVGGQRMQDEVDVAARGRRVHVGHGDQRTVDAADRLAAERASREYGDAIIIEAQRVLDDAARASASGLVSATDRALESIAVNEVSHAFNDERRRIERQLAREHRDTNWLPAIVKTWDATLDRRTCPRCAQLDGKVRPLGIAFPGKAETPMHRKCRCLTIIVASALYMGRSDSATLD